MFHEKLPFKHEHKKKVKAAKAAPKSSAKKERHDRWHIPHPHFPHWSRRSHADRHHHNAHIGTSGARATHAAPPPASYHKAAHEKLPHGWRQAGPGLYFNVVTGAMTAEHPLPLPKHWRLEKSAGTRGGIGGGVVGGVGGRGLLHLAHALAVLARKRLVRMSARLLERERLECLEPFAELFDEFWLLFGEVFFFRRIIDDVEKLLTDQFEIAAPDGRGTHASRDFENDLAARALQGSEDDISHIYAVEGTLLF